MDWPSVQDLGPKFNNVCQTSAISVLLDVHSIEKRRIQLNEHSDKHPFVFNRNNVTTFGWRDGKFEFSVLV